MGEVWEKMQTTQLVSGPPRSWKWGCMGVIGDPGDRATQQNEHFAWRWEASAMAARHGGWQLQRGIWKLKTTCASLGYCRGAWLSLDLRVAPFLEKSFPS